MNDHELQKLAIERSFTGELGKEDSDRLTAHCETCPACAEYLTQLRRNQNEFLDKHSFAQFQRRVQPELAQIPWRQSFVRQLRRPAFIPLYGVLAALLIAVPTISYRMFFNSGEAIVFKGVDHLSFIVKRGNVTSIGKPHDVFFANDEIQVLYSIRRGGFISLISVDSRGTISMYQPDTNGIYCSAPAQPGTNRVYPVGIELDGSKGVEMIVALLSDAPLKTTEVKQWVETARRAVSPDIQALPRRLEATKGKLKVDLLHLILHKG
jgi:hypothetical protein